MRQLLLLLLIGFAITFTSCRDDFNFEPSHGGLAFSKDTVYLDTVFSNIGSSTYTLKVYNHSNKDIKIPSIKLGQGNDSKYRLMVDGIPGKEFTDVELLAKDSMFVFIETNIDYSEYANNTTTFLYTDNIQFTSTNGTQQVELVTLVQDAYFLYPQKYADNEYEAVQFNDTTAIYGFNLDEADHDNEYHWNNTKPYVVYGYATVPNGKTLTVDAGARVHFHDQSGLLVQEGATLNINGDVSTDPAVMEKEVVFEGDRLEPDFADVPGQWSAIYLQSASDNTINHLTLKNANIGIYMLASADDSPRPKLTLSNSQIYNCTNFGILGVHAVIDAENVAANTAGQASVALTQGGAYNFKYCTIANYFNTYNQVPLLLNDYRQVTDGVNVSDLVANFDNCIMYGSGNIGLSLEKVADTATTTYQLKFNHCLIKLVDYGHQLNLNPLYPGTANAAATEGIATYIDNIIAASSTNNSPRFFDPQNNKLYIITGNSAADGKADEAVLTVFGTDITGIARTSPKDMGAYESVAGQN
jgi:hypothetical protein